MSHLRWCRFAAVALSSALAVAPAGILAQTPSRLALGGPPPSVRTEAELRAFLDELEAQELALGEATTLEAYYQWQGKARHFTGAFARLQTDLVTRRDYAAVIDRWQGKVRDSTLARRLFLHHRDFLASRADPRLSIQLVDLQTAIQDTVTAFRFDVRGRKLTLTGIGELLDTAADRSLREAAFRSRLQVTPHTMPSIVRALSLLDRIGRQEGFANGAAAGLNNSSLEPRRVLRDLDEFERATRPTYLAMLRRVRADLRVDRVEGWDVGYWLHQQETAGGVDPWPKEAGLERLRGLMRAIGFAVDSHRHQDLGRADRRNHLPRPPAVRGPPAQQSLQRVGLLQHAVPRVRARGELHADGPDPAGRVLPRRRDTTRRRPGRDPGVLRRRP
jgi:hypothetical protein